MRYAKRLYSDILAQIRMTPNHTFDTSLLVSAGVKRRMTDITRTRSPYKQSETAYEQDHSLGSEMTYPHFLVLQELQDEITQVLEVHFLVTV